MATTCKLIAKNVLGSDAATVTFSSIPGTYTDLLVVCSGRTDQSGDNTLNFRFNGDGGSNYTKRFVYTTGSSIGNVSQTSSYGNFGVVCVSGDTANTFGSSQAYIPNYAGSTAKSVSFSGATENNATAAAIQIGASLWSGTAAITSIVLYSAGSAGNFKSGSSFFLFGITKA